MPFPENLRTARLVLSRIGDADLPDYLCMHQDPRVMATLGGLCSVDELMLRHQRNLDHWHNHGFGWWAARDESSGKFAGRGGLRRVILDGRAEIELGYGFLPEFWGQGLASELAATSVQIGFEALNLTDIVSFTLPTNKASQRVMEKTGFVYERDGIWADLPHVFYRLTKNVWSARQSFTS